MITSCILFSKLKLSFNFFRFLYPSNFFAIAFYRFFKFLPGFPSYFLHEQLSFSQTLKQVEIPLHIPRF